MPRSSHDAENQCDGGMQLSTPRQVARLCYSWPLSPGRGMHIFAFSCQTRYRIASALYPCTWPCLPAASIRHQVRGTQPGCLVEHNRIEHRLDLTCLAHDPTHMQLRVCSPARLSGESVWVGVIIGMAPAWPGVIRGRKRKKKTATTTTKAATTTLTTTTGTTTSTSTNRLHTIVSSFLPLNHPLSKVVCFFEPS